MFFTMNYNMVIKAMKNNKNRENRYIFQRQIGETKEGILKKKVMRRIERETKRGHSTIYSGKSLFLRQHFLACNFFI